MPTQTNDPNEIATDDRQQFGENGVIPGLITANRLKKQKDKQNQLNFWSNLAKHSDGFDDHSKSVIFDNYSKLSAEELDLPKAHHGTWKNLIMGLHNALSSLNPNPADKSGESLQRLPEPGKASQANVDSGIAGVGPQQFNIPAYHPFTEQRRQQDQRERVMRETQLGLDVKRAGTDADTQESIRAVKVRTDALNKLHDQGYISDEQYGEAMAKAQADVTLKPDSSLSAKLKGNVTVQYSDGKTDTVEQLTNGDFRSTSTGETSKGLPEGARIVPNPKASQDPAKIREVTAEYVAVGYSEPQARVMAGWRLRGLDDLSARQKAVQTQRTGQQVATDEFFSGISGSAPSFGPPPYLSPNKPNPAFLGPKVQGGGGASPGMAPGAATGTASALVAGKSNAGAASPVKAPNSVGIGVGKDGKVATSQTAPIVDSTSQLKVGSPVSVQALIDKDPEVGLAIKYMSGMLKGSRNTSVMAGVMKGMEKLKRITGITDDNALSREITARDGTKKAYGMGIQRLAAYDQASGFVDAMGKAVAQAKARFGNDPRFWQKVKNHLATNVTGNPDTDALVTSINGYQSAYSRVMSGGQMSTAQTHVAAQERAGQVIDAAMKRTEISSVLKQVKLELSNERVAIISNNQKMRKALDSQWGQFETVLEGGDGSGNQSWGERNPKNKLERRYTHDGGKTWAFTNDGGKTWSAPRAGE